jgi:hypothetical protein
VLKKVQKQREVRDMTLTINFVDNTEAAPKLMATCNLDVDTNEPDGIKAEYQQVIQEIHAETAAELLARATETVLSRHPESVLLSVNDDRRLADPANTLNVNMRRKGTLNVEYIN